MSTRYARPLIAGSAAVLVATLGATAALAATTWTIRPGGAGSVSAVTFTHCTSPLGRDVHPARPRTCPGT